VRGLAALVVGSVAIVMGATVATREPWLDMPFRASSAAAGFSKEGFLGRRGPHGLVVHTDLEIDPWVEIDLLATRPVSRLLFVGHTVCCRQKGVPFEVQVAGEDRAFVTVARRPKRFEFWEARFPSRPARYVRIVGEGRTVLHLQSIEIP
jgi:hypothetical protein